MTNELTNYDKACLIYEKDGASAVIEAALEGELLVDHWGECVPCEADSPIEDGVCLVCGTKYEKFTYVVISFHEHEPMQVYGVFHSSEDAYKWAGEHAMFTTYTVNAILDITED